MPTGRRPGVYVQEVFSPSFASSAPSLSTAAFVGQIYRGPVEPSVVSSWSEYVQKFGAFDDPALMLAFSVYNFFNNGGRRAWISRAVGTGGVTATRTFDDGSATPQTSLTITAANPGVWGNNVYVAVIYRDPVAIAAGRFDLFVYYGGTNDAYIVERWTDLSMTKNDTQYIENVVNSPISGSNYISVDDPSAANVTGPKPGVITASVLALGDDGAAPTGGEITDAVDLMSTVEEPFGLNLPGVSDTTVLTSAINFADETAGGRGDVFVVVDPPAGSTPSTVISFTQSLPSSSYAAVYYPWLQFQDPSTTNVGQVRTLPPGGAVLGKYAETDASRGVYKAAAGYNTRIPTVAALERKQTKLELDNLNTNHVNAIKALPGAGFVIFGTRTVRTTPTADRYVPVRRTLIYLKKALLDITAFAVFENNDAITWTSLRNTISQFLLGFWQSGGLKGASSGEAYFVKCDEENNSPATIAAGEVHVDVGVALQRPSEFIVIRVGQWEGGQAVQEIGI